MANRGIYSPVRLFSILPTLYALCAVLATTAAHAAPYQLVEDEALGITLPDDHQLLGDKPGPAIEACLAKDPPTGSALFWVEVGKTGAVSVAKVHGAGKPALDLCLAAALKKATVTDKLATPVVLVGHLDLAAEGKDALMPSPRKSPASVLLDPHGARWQVTVSQLAYTANRALDIAAALDGASAAIAGCAGKRGAKAEAAPGIAWTDGKAIVKSGTPAYDNCLAAAFSAIKLPAPESSLWMVLTITPPAEALAARTNKAGMGRDQLLRDALTTAVRSRKPVLLDCLDGHPKAKLVKVTVELKAAKANIKKVSTGDGDADACVRNKFQDTPIKAANDSDKVELEITLDPVNE